MSTLLQIQNKFQEYLLNSNDQIHQYIVSTEKVPAEMRLEIYSHAYRSRLLEALETSYPVLKAYMGDECFAELGLDYMNKFPSSYRSIRWFGDQLANFISTQEDYNNFPYLFELAQLEWTLTLVFDAIDCPVLQLEEVAKIPPELWMNMRLYAHSSTYRLNLLWNVMNIWQSITDEKTPNEPLQSQFPIPWVLWRNNLINQFCSLSESEAWAIDALLKGSTFGDICEGLCQWIDEQHVAMHAASLLKGWIASGLITRVEF